MIRRILAPTFPTRFAAALLIAATACSGDSTQPSPAVAIVEFTTAPSQFLLAGEQQQLAAQARDGNGAQIAGVTMTWSTADSRIATVSSSGLLTAVSAGMTAVTVSAGGKSMSLPVNVSDAIQSVSVVYPDDIFEVGGSHQLGLQVRDGAGTTIPNPTATWRSERTSVATVTASGMLAIVGTQNDSVIITAARGGKEGRFRFFAWPSVVPDVPTPIAGVADQSRWFLVRTTSETSRLTITLNGGDGDADLYLWAPGTWADALLVCESFEPDNTEECVIENPQPGLWSIEVYGYVPYQNVQLRATLTRR